MDCFHECNQSYYILFACRTFYIHLTLNQYATLFKMGTRLYKDRFIVSIHPMIAAIAYVASGKIDHYFEEKKLHTNAFHIHSNG